MCIDILDNHGHPVGWASAIAGPKLIPAIFEQSSSLFRIATKGRWNQSKGLRRKSNRKHGIHGIIAKVHGPADFATRAKNYESFQRHLTFKSGKELAHRKRGVLSTTDVSSKKPHDSKALSYARPLYYDSW